MDSVGEYGKNRQQRQARGPLQEHSEEADDALRVLPGDRLLAILRESSCVPQAGEPKESDGTLTPGRTLPTRSSGRRRLTHAGADGQREGEPEHEAHSDGYLGVDQRTRPCVGT
jgi:hypothetical protein